MNWGIHKGHEEHEGERRKGRVFVGARFDAQFDRAWSNGNKYIPGRRVMAPNNKRLSIAVAYQSRLPFGGISVARAPVNATTPAHFHMIVD
jgi:hypothetical protein